MSRAGPWRKSHVRRLGLEGTRVLVFRFHRLSESPPGSSRGWVLKVDTTNIPISQQCPPLSESQRYLTTHHATPYWPTTRTLTGSRRCGEGSANSVHTFWHLLTRNSSTDEWRSFDLAYSMALNVCKRSLQGAVIHAACHLKSHSRTLTACPSAHACPITAASAFYPITALPCPPPCQSNR